MTRTIPTLWTARILPRTETKTVRDLNYNSDITLDGKWIASGGRDHTTLLLAHDAKNGPRRYQMSTGK